MVYYREHKLKMKKNYYILYNILYYERVRVYVTPN